ncbi:MAG: Zeta toxin [Betaproteobacteria bacterium]|nr:Zeta toxin [Betaproteobacteria bacterium]
MTPTADEARIEAAALAFARAQKKAIAKRVTDAAIHPPEQRSVSVFMAGSPGAGKTEASLELLKNFGESAVIRIDPDELRNEFPAYNGTNAWLFQKAVSVLVDRIHDVVLDQGQSFLLDGTLSHLGVARKNIERSLKKGRAVQILYVYQEPRLAWDFVQTREVLEGRRIEPEIFVVQYFAARTVVNQLKREFGSQIQVDLLMKNNDYTQRFYRAGVDQIDNHIPEKYSRDDVEKLLKPS